MKWFRLQQCSLLDVALLDSLFIQVLYELLSLHPVDERADVTAVAEKRPASQVQSTSCEDRRWHAWWHAWLSRWLVKGTPFMCTAPKILHHIISLPSKPVTVAETLHVILSVTWAFKIFAQTFPQQTQTCTGTQILSLKVHVKSGRMSERVSWTHNIYQEMWSCD